MASLHPLSELPHPIIVKALTSFGDDPTNDNYVGVIASSPDKLPLLSRWLPTEDDVRLLQRERAAKRLSDWELDVQRLVLEELRKVHEGGSTRFDLPHPAASQGRMASVTLAVTPDRESECPVDRVDLDTVPASRFAGGELFWAATIRVLITLSPPEQRWDRYGDTYSAMEEPGQMTRRIGDLEKLVDDGDLAESTPGEHAHYAHREHIAGSAVEETALRARCGAFFVQTQLPESLPACPNCAQRWTELSS